jgi:hypothetical protein
LFDFTTQEDATLEKVEELATKIEDVLNDAAMEDYEINQMESALKQVSVHM